MPSTDITDLEHIDHLRTMLDDDGTLYDWSQDDTDALEFALWCAAKLRRIQQVLTTGVRRVQL